MIFKNMQYTLIEGLLSIAAVLIAAILFFTGPIPVKNIIAFNSNLLLKTTELNKDIRHIKRGTDKVIYYGILKPSQSQKTHFKQALNNLESSLKRTDKQYKELDVFIKKNSAFSKHDGQITVYFNKSYFKWKNISRPILKIIIKHPKYISSRISYKLFLKHTLYLSHLPTVNIIKDTKLYSGRFINIAIYTTIAGVIIILLLGILFFRYFNKNKFIEIETLLKSEQRFKSFFYNLPLPSFIVDVESGRFMDANNIAVKFYGYSKDELLNMDVDNINVSHTPQELKTFRGTTAAEGGGVAVFQHKLKNGEIKIVQSHAAVITLNNKRYLLVIILDITEKIANEKWMHILYTAIENSPDWMIVTDNLGNITYANKGVEDISGYKKEELIGKKPSIFKSGLLDPEFYKTFWNIINAGEVFKGILINRKKTGELFTLSETIVPVKKDFKVINFVAIAKDITQEKTLGEELRYISLYDPITKLPNRSFFISTINDYLVSAEYRGLKASLVIVDFYRLSYINNAYGYSTGDRLLQSFSKKLSRIARGGDIIARIGGDEFGILFADLQNKEDILQIIDKIKEEFKTPLYLDEISPAESGNERKSFNVSFTMGISTFPDDGRNAGDLLKSADIALSSAKEQGEGEYEFFTASMNTRASEFLLMKNGIINAFQNGEFLIYYQPYFNIKTGKINGLEALARWNSPDVGLIPPVKFIPLLEKMGLIRRFEEFLIDKICGNLKEWEEKGIGIVPVSVNISPASFRKEGLIDMIVSALGRYEIGPSLFNIEITEGLFMQNLDYALKILNIFKEKGIKILLDDFGTGYSSLSYIKNIPADFIKIDISFIRGMMENPKDLAIVNTVVVLASKLGMKTIGEGVETEEQLEILKSLGCDLAQGCLFSKPVPEDELLRFLKQP